MTNTKITLLALLCTTSLFLSACSNHLDSSGGDEHTMITDGPEPINYIRYDEKFASAGMPQAKHIERFAEQGVQLIINVAPPDADGALVDEAQLSKQAGIPYVNIPVAWNAPTEADVELFLRTMRNAKDQSVVLHCQMNMRATAFAFLYRVIDKQVPPQQALIDMQTIWTPNPTWTTLINKSLARYDIDFALALPSEN